MECAKAQRKSDRKIDAVAKKGAQPNNMAYKDGSGAYRSVYLPQGTMYIAWDHLENERWDELAKFEPYSESKLFLHINRPLLTSPRLYIANQGYSETDFRLVNKDVQES